MRQIVILDFGSQYTQLIARRLRENGVYAEIFPFHTPLGEIEAKNPAGIILSGGPASVHEAKSPRPDPGVYTLGVPLLGICYGMQLMAAQSGGKVAPAGKREYGFSEVRVALKSCPLFAGIKPKFQAWMSHGDGVTGTGSSLKTAARTGDSGFAAVFDGQRNWYGVQFHPEVAHTGEGSKILDNFARKICGIKGRWTPAAMLGETVARIKEQAGEGSVICGLSGGVDSSVTAAIVARAVGKRLHCIFVDTGLLRDGDRERVEKHLGCSLGLRVKTVDASALFLKRLSGVSDPEKKRKIIGNTFIEVFEREARAVKGARFLAQGTLYPDVIESVSVLGPSATIKSHHNVGGLPEKMKLELIEPLRCLFKDEVRRLGAGMGMPREALEVQPFPGPGLAIRILSDITKERLTLLRAADKILRDEFRRTGWDKKAWQSFTVLLPVQSVGVMGDGRTYEHTIVLRSVDSSDGMTADWTRLPHELMRLISSRIVSELRGINRVVYDITSKPPATIEWE
ncbi:MAG: glutamine-hydrolyzing GMP synthase [Elusimicrobiales bacterium]|nr:glutamine-hydrolyzing GMP synthase [Elusimicrobiales bacterium]